MSGVKATNAAHGPSPVATDNVTAGQLLQDTEHSMPSTHSLHLLTDREAIVV